MGKQRKPTADSAPRSVGDMTITPAVVKRRKWSKAPPSTAQGTFFGPPQPQSTLTTEISGIDQPAAEDRSAGPEGEHRTAAAGGLFQSNGHCCDQIYSTEDLGEFIGYAYRVRPCRCKKWFCSDCGPSMGYNLRNRLLFRLKEFKQVYGVTLTVDGSLFANPEESWLYVMQNRLLARFARDLRKRDVLHGPHYFWVVEFQHNEQPHWHFLFDATSIPHGVLVEIWSRFRPRTASPLTEKITAKNYKGHVPAFGSVAYTAPTYREKAGYYATKYLCKYPKNGYPDWVLDRCGRMPRYGHSHKFFPRASLHSPMCFCPECRRDIEPPPKPRVVKENAEPSTNRRVESKTIRERVEQCSDQCTIVQVKQIMFPDGTIQDGKGKFNGQLKISYAAACEYMGVSPDDHWQLELDGNQATELENFASYGEHRGRAA